MTYDEKRWYLKCISRLEDATEAEDTPKMDKILRYLLAKIAIEHLEGEIK